MQLPLKWHYLVVLTNGFSRFSQIWQESFVCHWSLEETSRRAFYNRLDLGWRIQVCQMPFDIASILEEFAGPLESPDTSLSAPHCREEEKYR